jgi:hypothetical protein
MRIVELVDRHAAGTLRVLRTGGTDDLERHLRPTGADPVDVVAGTAADARPGDLVVDLLGPADHGGHELAELEQVIAALDHDAALVVLLTGPLYRVPVAGLVGALTLAGLQVVEAAPLEHARVTGAVVARHGSKLLPFAPYLSDRLPVEVDDDAVLRLVNEYQLEGLAARARHQTTRRVFDELRAEQERSRALREELDAVTASLRQEQKRREALESSRSVRLGLALGRFRHHPVEGAKAVPGALRGRKPPT